MSKEQSDYLWYFGGKPKMSQEAPELKGRNGQGDNGLLDIGSKIGNEIKPDLEKYTYIDVSRNFSWTLNDERDEVPRVILKELVQNQAALINRGMYYLGQSTDILQILTLFTGPLSSYKGLYSTNDTGFFYDLPNLGGNYFTTGSNSFGADQSGSYFRGLVDKAGNMAEAIGGGANPISGAIKGVGVAGDAVAGLGEFVGRAREIISGGGGYYTESPKFYQHGGNARSYDISFPLFNTTTWEDVITNFQLVFMLVYQNIPNRGSKQIVMPPCIYEVTVPGISYTPYAYMSSVDVKFVGAVREMTLPLPFESIDKFENVRVSVPEAYDVRLNLQELVGNTRNFMYHNVKRKINTGIETIDQGLGEVETD